MVDKQGDRNRPTIRDVAALSGSSLKTVSRVINGEPTVSPELASRVRRAIDQLGYRHNVAASNLRRNDGRTNTVGLLLEDVANPYSAAVHRAVEDVAQQHGVAVLAASLDEDPDREREVLAAFARRRVDGLIVVPASDDHSYLLEEARAGTSIVFIDRPPRFFDADTVLTDDREGARAGVRHLVAGGHRQIGLLGDLNRIYTARERVEGALTALREEGIDVEAQHVRRDLRTIDAARDATIDLLDGPAPPTAIFAAQNLITIGALRALHARESQHRVALVGFDDFSLADLVEPGVTVVAQDPKRIGELAAEELFLRIGGDRSPTRRHVVPTQLVARGSGEIPPPS